MKLDRALIRDIIWRNLNETTRDGQVTSAGIERAAIEIAKLVETPATSPLSNLPQGDWRTMESAPRDGTPILAYNPLVGVYSTAFTTRWTGEPDETGYEGFPCGFWPSGPRSYPFGKWDCQPTHWKPSPTPPARREPARPDGTPSPLARAENVTGPERDRHVARGMDASRSPPG